MKEYYLKATKLMGKPSFNDVLDEVKELLQDKSMEEVSDVLHSTCRYLSIPDSLTWIVANKTAAKHAERMKSRGCPRSERNCLAAAENCCCSK